MRIRREREAHIIHFSFFDILFGAFGAFVFLMLMHVLRTINLVEVDFAKQFDELVQERKQLVAQVENYKEKERVFVEIEKKYNELSARIKEEIATKEALQNRINKLETELASLSKMKEEYMKRGAVEDALKRENMELKKSLDEAHKKLSAIVTLPLRIKTLALPTVVAEENINIALSAEGGKPPYRWVLEGKLPSGLYLDRENGYLLGKTSKTGNYTIKLKVTDAVGNTQTSKDITFSIVQKPEVKKGISPWILVLTVISVSLLAYILYMKYKAWKYIKKMEREGWILVWGRKEQVQGRGQE